MTKLPTGPTQAIVPPTLILDGKVAIAFVDDINIMITDVQKWTDTDLIKVMEELARLGGLRANPRAYTHYFGEAFGSDATQRKLLVDWQTAHNVPAVQKVLNITDSAIMRAALTAYAWMTKTDAKAFKSADIDTACAWLTQGCSTSPQAVKSAALGCYKLLGKTPH